MKSLFLRQCRPLDSCLPTKHVGAIQEDARSADLAMIPLRGNFPCIELTVLRQRKNLFWDELMLSSLGDGLRHVKGFRASSGFGFRDETYTLFIGPLL